MNELNCNEVVGQWRNFGDNNPIEYGTKFVKADVENEGCYNVIVINTEWTTGEDGFRLSQGYVDLNSDFINWDDIKGFAGNEIVSKETENGYKVAAVVEYYGLDEFGKETLSNEFGVNFNGDGNFVESEAEAIALLNKHGILLERANEILKATVINHNESKLIYVMKDDVESIGETVDDEGVINLSSYNKIIVSESLEQLQTLLKGYDVEVITDNEDEDED